MMRGKKEQQNKRAITSSPRQQVMPNLIAMDSSNSSFSNWSVDDSSSGLLPLPSSPVSPAPAAGDDLVKYQRRRAWKRIVREEANDLFRCCHRQQQQNALSSSGSEEKACRGCGCRCDGYYLDDLESKKKQWCRETMCHVQVAIDRGAPHKEIQRMLEHHVDKCQKRLKFLERRLKKMSLAASIDISIH